nr:hypothetical protein [Desulfobacteraceae bacterium]
PIIAGSPYHRYYPVDQAVRYYLDTDNTTLRRAEIPITSENADLSTFPTGFPLVKNMKPNSLQFSYLPPTLTRNAVVSIAFTIARDGEEVAFHKEVQIRNVP